MPAAVGERRKPARDHDDSRLATAPPRERDEMVLLGAAHLQLLVIAIRKDVGKLGPKPEQMLGPGKLQMPAWPFLDEMFPIRILECVESSCAFAEVDRPPVIGIDQRKIPEFG